MTVQEQIDDLKKKLTANIVAEQQISLLLELLNKYNSIASPDSAPYVQQLKKLAGSADAVTLAWSTFYEGILLKNQVKFPEAIAQIKQALQMFERCNSAKGTTAAHINCGICYRQLSNYTEAIYHQNKALEIAESNGDKRSVSLAQNNLGNVRMEMGDYATALNHHLQAMRIRRDLDDKVNLSSSYRNVGNIYFKQKQYDKALESYEESHKISKQQNDKSGIAGSLCNLGIIHELEKRFELSLACYEEAKLIYEEAKDINSLSIVLHNMGIVCHMMERNDEAEKHMLHSIQINESVDRLHGTCYHRTYYAMFLKDMKRYDEALEQAKKALIEYEQLGSKDNLYNVYLTLSEIYEAIGKGDEALKAYKEYHRLDAEVLGKEATAQLTQLNFQHQSEQKEAIHKATEKILHNILPKSIADKIKDGEEKIIEKFNEASVLFADMVGFTVWSRERDVNEVAETLNHIFNLFDKLADEHGVEKIKTIGDAYMCVAGLPERCEDHAERMAKMALAMHEQIQSAYPNGEIKLRIGIHCGEVIAGVLGKNKYAYDLWGDTVNTASRMESHGEPGKIQVSDNFRRALTGSAFGFEERGEIEVKGKGKMKTFFLE